MPDTIMWHYDLRLICPITGELEATEDMGLTFERACHALARAHGERSRYALVSCDRPGSDAIHNVDLAYHVHHAVHAGYADWGYCEYVGTPQDDWFAWPTRPW